MMSCESPTKIESETFNLQEGEYQLEMTLYNDDTIEFKIIQNNAVATCYYIEKYNFEKITKISYINRDFCDGMKEVYQIYKTIFKDKKICLILSQDKNIMNINYKTMVNNIKEKEVNLELKKKDLEKDDKINALLKEVENIKKESNEKYIYYEKKIDELKKENEKMKKDIDFLMGEYNKKIEKEKQEEIKRINEEQKEKEFQKEIEEFSSKNDNVNLINDYKFENIKEIKNIKNTDTIAFPKAEFHNINSVAVYCMIKNNERLYQMAYCQKNKEHDYYYIIIYDLIKKRKVNKIATSFYNGINKIQHYYNLSNKEHILLGSNQQNISLWRISSNPIMNILTIKDYKNYYACLLFINENFFIFGLNNGSICCWDQKGSQQPNINNSKINGYMCYIEATYIDDKKYILIAGRNSNNSNVDFTECYDFDQHKIIKTFKENNDKSNSYIYSVNLFKKGNDIYLITCNEKKIIIYDFYSADIKNELSFNKVRSMCSINQKYFVVSDLDKMKIINIENYSQQEISLKYLDDTNQDESFLFFLIKKIKIPEKGEYILTFSKHLVQIWKI